MIFKQRMFHFIPKFKKLTNIFGFNSFLIEKIHRKIGLNLRSFSIKLRLFHSLRVSAYFSKLVKTKTLKNLIKKEISFYHIIRSFKGVHNSNKLKSFIREREDDKKKKKVKNKKKS